MFGRLKEKIKNVNWRRGMGSLGNFKDVLGDYIEVIVLLALAPTILAMWATFKGSVTDTNVQNVLDALSTVISLAIAGIAIAKVAKE